MRSNRNTRKLLFPVLMVGLLGFASVGYPADRIPVEITHNGRTASYELVRLYPDRVVVMDSRNQTREISRRDIKNATNTNVRHLIDEASDLISRFPECNLEHFHKLAESLEQILVRIDEASLLYGWLLPEASMTARLVRQTDQPVKETRTIFLSVQSEYENMRSQVQSGASMDVNWEEFFNRLEHLTLAIPFPTVRKEFLAKVRKDNQKLKALVRKSSEDRITTLQNLMKEVDQLLAAETLTQAQWQVSLQQLQQTASGIPESDPKVKWSREIQVFQNNTARRLHLLEEKRALEKLASVIKQAEAQIRSTSPDINSLEKYLGDIRSQVAQFSESPTQVALSSQLADLREQLASKSIAMASAALNAQKSQKPISSQWISSLRKQVRKYLPGSLVQNNVVLWGLGAGCGLILLLAVVRLLKRPTRPESPQQVLAPPVPPPSATPALQMTVAEEMVPEPEPVVETSHIEGVGPTQLKEETVEEQAVVIQPVSLVDQTEETTSSESGFEQPIPEPLPALPDGFEVIQPTSDIPRLASEDGVATTPEGGPLEHVLEEEPVPEPPIESVPTTPPFQASFLFPEWTHISPARKLSRVVMSSESLSQIKEGLSIGTGTPLSLHETDQWLFLIKSHGDHETEILALDRYSDQTELHSLARIPSQKGAFCFHHDQVWILEGSRLSVTVFSHGHWIEKIHLDIPPLNLQEETSEIPSFAPKIRVSDQAMLFSRSPGCTEGFWLTFEANTLKFEAWETPIARDIIDLSEAPGEYYGITRQGEPVFVSGSNKNWTLGEPLPGIGDSLSESLVSMIQQTLICPQPGEENFWKLRSWDIKQQSPLSRSIDFPGKPLSIHSFPDGVVMVNEKGIFYLDTPYLSLRWDFFSLKGHPMRIAVDPIHVALLIRHEENDLILILGRNSGVDLWDISPEEHGLSSIRDLLIYDDQVLLLGVLPDGSGCLKLV